MRSKFAILLLATAVAGCATANAGQQSARRGVEAVNVPVIQRTDYVLDLAAPGGVLPASEAARLTEWFRSLRIGYGDNVYVDGPYAEAARAQVSQISGMYGLLVDASAPVTAGAVPPGTVRVVVSRNRASVPGCPNWGNGWDPNYANRTMPNFGCAVNGNLAAMVADPRDLIHGRADPSVSDTLTADKAIDLYRKTEPTGSKGLQDINTKKDDQ